MRRYLWRAVAYLLLISWALFIFVPIYWAVITSFKTELDVYLGPKFLPWVDFQPTIRTWKKFFTTEWYVLSRPLTNSLIVASVSAFFAVVMGMMAAYALTRFRFHFGPMRNQDILFWIVAQRMMPPIVTVLAIFIILRTVNLLDTHVGLILVYIAFNLPLGWGEVPYRQGLNMLKGTGVNITLEIYPRYEQYYARCLAEIKAIVEEER